ncbi:MAG: hypothetical protein RI988_92 [Pseudomonadota bacterium]
MKPLRLLYLPNEVTEGDQIGPRKAFSQMLRDGRLADYQAYSFLVERQRHATQAQALQDLLDAARRFGPDLVYWQHVTTDYPVDADFLRALKALPTRPRLVWHDPDPYGRFIKPIDPVMKLVIAHADLAVVKGLGTFAQDVRRAGAPRLLYAVESFDDERFGQPWTPSPTREFDAVMVANLTCLWRMPFLFMPGGRSRLRLACRLHEALGQRFAVYGTGQGWRGRPFCRGPIAFADQERIIRTAWVSVNWSQFDTIPMYFSDRLPISLAAGVPHVTNYQRGFEHALPQARGIYFVHSPAEAVDVVDMLLSLPREQLLALGEEAARYARERLNATRVYADIVEAIQERLFGG